VIPFPDKRYSIIYADPPWRYTNYEDDTTSRWVGNEYPLMDVSDLVELPVRNIVEKDCALLIWATWPTIQDAFKVIEAWGFEYSTCAFVWVKTNQNIESDFVGNGYLTRSNTEFVLFARKGHPKRVSAGIKQVIREPVQEHSRKPEEARRRIERLFGDVSRIELFARWKPFGWDAWGNQVEELPTLETFASQ